MSTPRPPSSRPQPAAGAPAGAPASSLTTKQRIRVRKIVRRSLVGVITVQLLFIGLITTPKSDAVIPVFDLRALVQDGLAYAQDFLNLKEQWTNNGFTGIVKNIAEQNVKGLDQFGGHGILTNIDVDDVSQRPVEAALASNRHRVTIPGSGGIRGQQPRQTHFGYTNRNAARDIQELMPISEPWRNYEDQYLASAEGTATTLRGSLEALNNVHLSMQEDNRRFTDLRNRADRVDSQLALAQVQVDGQLELARQIQRANTLSALHTNIYAVSEMRRIDNEARTVAKTKRDGCEIAAMLSGAAVGGIAGDVVGQLVNSGC